MAFDLEKDVCEEFDNFSDIEECTKEEAERYSLVHMYSSGAHKL